MIKSKVKIEKEDLTITDFKIGDFLKLPFNETGIVINVIDHLPWGNRIEVKITDSTLNEVGDIIDYFPHQIEHLKK